MFEKTKPSSKTYQPRTSSATCEQRIVHLDAVREARSQVIPIVKAGKLAEFLTLLGDTSRLRILSALSGRELCVCDIAAVVNLSESAASHQLRVLRQMNLVIYRKEGRVAYYSLTSRSVALICESVTQMLEGLSSPRQRKSKRS